MIALGGPKSGSPLKSNLDISEPTHHRHRKENVDTKNHCVGSKIPKCQGQKTHSPPHSIQYQEHLLLPSQPPSSPNLFASLAPLHLHHHDPVQGIIFNHVDECKSELPPTGLQCGPSILHLHTNQPWYLLALASSASPHPSSLHPHNGMHASYEAPSSGISPVGSWQGTNF